MLRLSKAEFESNRRPCVYVAMREGNPIYIGKSHHGLARVYNVQPYPHVNRAQAFQEMDEIKVMHYDTQRDADDLEACLIHEYHPKYNKQCEVCERFYLDPRLRAISITCKERQK